MSKFPNKKTQFKKGESGNPVGRPKGSKNLKTNLKKLLAGLDPAGEWAHPVAKKLIQKAFRDDNFRALVEIINRIEGKSLNKSEVDQQVSGEIRFTPEQRKEEIARLKKMLEDE